MSISLRHLRGPALALFPDWNLGIRTETITRPISSTLPPIPTWSTPGACPAARVPPWWVSDNATGLATLSPTEPEPNKASVVTNPRRRCRQNRAHRQAVYLQRQ